MIYFEVYLIVGSCRSISLLLVQHMIFNKLKGTPEYTKKLQLDFSHYIDNLKACKQALNDTKDISALAKIKCAFWMKGDSNGLERNCCKSVLYIQYN